MLDNHMIHGADKILDRGWSCPHCGSTKDPAEAGYCSAADMDCEDVGECPYGPCQSCKDYIPAVRCRDCDMVTC